MYKIGICDDDQKFCCEMKKYLIEYSRKEMIDVQIEIFITPERFLEYIQKRDPFDILFLDIELEKMNGIIVGRKIREVFKNEMTQIVYVSSKENYAMQLFQVRPMDFLIKPIRLRDIIRVMQVYRNIYNNQKTYFVYHIGKQQYSITEEHVIYFRSEGKKIYIVTQSDEKEFYGKLSEVEKQINMNKFCVVHKSYIINMNYVLEYRANEVIMTNGDRIPISQSKRRAVKEKILKKSIFEGR